MLFNSPEFIFAFLPITLAGFFLAGRFSRTWAFGWVVIASLGFYAWWNPLNVPIIAVSLAVNYAFARLIGRLAVTPERNALRLALLIAGVTFNVLFLGYFKYINFVESTLNELAGTEFVIVHVVLPLGISFITFQKIAFLIDVHAGRIEKFTAGEFCLFVLFFPQLIAGPIVHFREMMPQFRSNPCRFDKVAFASGLTLFCLGLFKKVVLADGIAEHVSPLYAQAASGATMSLFPAWAAAVGFTLQIYFDFSGYSDMALGIARCFGVRLPLNFNSPLKATSIIDFWLRWHVTLTRFLTAYIYNPLALALTRRRAAKGGALRGGPSASVGAFLQLLAGPTLLTMFISGLWHGAGWLFILWGLVHGVYLTVNHAWRIVMRKIWTDQVSYARVMGPIGFLLTFTSVAAAMVLFRSTTGAAATELLAGMFGLHGITLPRGLIEPLGLAGALPIGLDEGGAVDFVMTYLWLGALFMIATLLPNSLQVLARYEPALDAQQRAGHAASPPPARLSWQPTVSWALVVSVVAAAAILQLSPDSEFLYWQF